MGMHVRRAKRSDFNDIASIAVQAHTCDANFKYLFPKRDSHPAAYKASFLSHVKHHSIIPQCLVTVVEIEADDAKPQIAGYCLWYRESEGNVTVDRWWEREGFVQKVRRRLLTSTLADHLSMLLNPAASFRHSLHYGHSDEQYDDPGYKDPDGFWGISELAVAPRFQRQGVGALLLKWGMDVARQERLPIILASTPAGLRLYEKAGFHRYGTWKSAEQVDETYTMMRWDPPITSS